MQYRHWDQVLCDVLHLGERIVMADGIDTYLVPADAEHLMAQAGWNLGLAAWRSLT